MLSLALAALLATPGELVLPWGTGPAAPSAVDHVATVAVDPGYGPEPRDQRYELTRSGTWLREVRGGAISHHDFASGVSIEYGAGNAPGNWGFSINRHASNEDHYRYRRTPTGERDRLLGEECFVWRFERVGATQGDLAYLSCETADGIQLWARTLSGQTGHVLASSRTLSVARRPVAAAEVLPPRGLLRWRSWRAVARPAEPVAPPSNRPPDYEVRLEGGGDGTQRAHIVRASRGWTYQESRWPHMRSLMIRSVAVAIDYREEADGRPLSLTVRPISAAERQSVLPPLPEGPLPPPVDRVIGEDCSWAEPPPGPAIVVTSGTNRRCITRDGLPLRIIYGHRGPVTNLTATHIARRPLPMRALEPPRSAFSWSAWGLRPAD